MKKTQITLALNALALAGMLVFAAQAADAATNPKPSVDVPQHETAQAVPSVDTDSTDVADTTDVDSATEVASADVGDIETPDVGEIDSVSEMEGPDGPESN